VRSALGGALLPGLLTGPAAAQRKGTGTDYDVLIMGAGVAGLATAAALLHSDHELKVLVLEARERLGGRVYSVPRRELIWDVEFGARYIDPPGGMDWPPLSPLGLRMERVEQDRLRLYPGMSTLVKSLAGASMGLVQLDCAVTEVLWRTGLIGVYYRNRGLESAVTARRMVCTLPAPLLREGGTGPQFSPRLPQEKRDALRVLSFEDSINIALIVPSTALKNPPEGGQKNWERRGTGVLLRATRAGESGEWLLEAQYTGPAAMALGGRSELLLCLQARDEFVRALGLGDEAEILWQGAVDWQSEAYTRAAKTLDSGAAVHATLATGLDNTLFFAGEATADPSAVGTVHGAYASGERAAAEVMESLGLPASDSEDEAEVAG